jgi:hypothetical protein
MNDMNGAGVGGYRHPRYTSPLAIIVPICNYLVNKFWVFLQPRGICSRSLEIIIPG